MNLPLSATLPYRVHNTCAPPAALRALIDCGTAAQTQHWQLDWTRLDARSRAILESGEYLPALAFHWLERTAAILQFCTQQQYSAAILDVPARRLTQLSVSDVLAVMGSDLWLADGQIALVWGFASEALIRRWQHPLSCRGALYPCTDGLDTAFCAQPDDLAKIAEFS
ncbi:MAG: hypothetical protein Q4D61_06780 [Cardiobacteriaceae bacterium]|nr:hypothetical protein [Cardiobacteriaceae bacterium]